MITVGGVGAPTRRTVLAAALAAGLGVMPALSACTRERSRPPEPPSPEPPRLDPDGPLKERLAAEKSTLIERYAATVQRHPRLASRLRRLQANHDAHLAALGPGNTLGGTRSPAAAPPRVPADPVAAVRSLERAEQAAAARRIDQCVQTVDPQLASLIASIGACEAGHAALLRRSSR